MSVQVGNGYYVSKKYATLERFITYFYQVDAIRRVAPKKLLFIGVGDGLVPHFLRNSGIEVVTLDFDPALVPDVVGDIRSLPFPDNAFDAVCAFEVLEHLPFPESEQALGEIARVARTHAVVSVPHRRTAFEMVIKFPYIRSILKRDFIDIALRFPVKFPGFAVSKQHYWEIDGHTTRLGTFRTALRKHFTILSEKTPVLDPYRRFFELSNQPVSST